MQISVWGAGAVGYALAEALADAGHSVTLAARSVDSPSLDRWRELGGVAAAYGEAAQADVIVNATPGLASAGLFESLSDEIDTQVLWDVANPLDFTRGPAVIQEGGVSLGERLQITLAHTPVVKALNTVNTSVMTDPASLAGPHEIPLCGDDEAAKSIVRGLLGDLGWRPEQILDLGDITASRATEQYLLLWIRLMGFVGSPQFNIHLVRSSDG